MAIEQDRIDDEAPVNPSSNPTFQSVLTARLSRRGFLASAGIGVAAAVTGQVASRRPVEAQGASAFAPVKAANEDKLLLPPGYKHSVLIRWGDPLFPGAAELDPAAQTAARQERQFGYDNDFIGFVPLPAGSDVATRGLLGVNHENARPELMWAAWDGKAERTREMCEVEVAAHGFTVVEIARGPQGEWTENRYDPANRAAATALLDEGVLYVAKFHDDGTGEWLPLVQGQGPLTAANGFPSQAEVVINARGAGDLVGATKMDRPEDVEPSPRTGKVYCALTSNDARKPEQVDKANPRAANKYGHILELIEDGGDHANLRFRWEILLLGGDPKDASHGAYYQGRTDVSPLAAPDNFAFDDQGRLWVATDGMDDTLGPNDAVFVVDTEGPLRGRALQFLSAPTGCEVCGPAFTPDNRTFFVAIQHPGLVDKATYASPGSRWPDYRPDMPPRPSVVAIYREDGGKIGG